MDGLMHYGMECVTNSELKRKKKRVLPEWITNGGKKIEPPPTEKIDSDSPEKNKEHENKKNKLGKKDLMLTEKKEKVILKKKEKMLKEGKKENVRIEKIAKIFEKKEIKDKKKIKNPTLVTLECVKVEGPEKANMPCPPSQRESNYQVLQNMAAPTPLSSNADLDGTNANPANTSRDVLPLSEKTDQLAQARVTVPRDARLAVMPNDARETVTRVADLPPVEGATSICPNLEDWPEGDSDQELEEQMLMLSIRHEKEKEERLREVERKRKEADRKFLLEVKEIEDRHERLKRQKQKSEEARRKHQHQQLLKTGSIPSSSTPGAPPTLPAKMPSLGKEPWCSTLRKKEMVPEGEGEMPVGEGAETGSSPECPATPPSTPGPTTAHNNTPPTQDGSTAVRVSQGDLSNMVDKTTTAKVTKEEAMTKEHKLQPSLAELKRLKMQELRKKKRLLTMSSSRNLEEALPGPGLTPGGCQGVSKLISKFETDPSPIKMPRPPQQAHQRAGQHPGCPLATIPYTSTMPAAPVPAYSRK